MGNRVLGNDGGGVVGAFAMTPNIHMVRRVYRMSHTDKRQTFTEVFKDERIKQVNACEMNKDVRKLRHYHANQTDWWWVMRGELILHLFDLRQDSPTFGQADEVLLTGEDNSVVEIPPMVAHGCTVLEGPCILIYATDRFYDPQDEYRIP